MRHTKRQTKSERTSDGLDEETNGQRDKIRETKRQKQSKPTTDSPDEGTNERRDKLIDSPRDRQEVKNLPLTAPRQPKNAITIMIAPATIIK